MVASIGLTDGIDCVCMDGDGDRDAKGWMCSTAWLHTRSSLGICRCKINYRIEFVALDTLMLYGSFPLKAF